MKPDLDQIEALSSEREALWARLEKASFLTDDEKRASIGYGPRGGLLLPAPAQAPTRGGQGGIRSPSSPPSPRPSPQGEREDPRSAKFNPYHDELGRFTTADGAGGGADPVADNPFEIVVEHGDGDEADTQGDELRADGDEGFLQLVNSRRAQSVTVGGRTYQATPEQATVLSTSASRADSAMRRVRELDPEWRPAPSLSGPNSAEGAIATYRALAQQAEARLTVIERGGLPLGFNTREEYASFGRSARTALNEAGYPEAVPYMRGSAVTGYSYRTGEAFDVGRRSDYDLAIVSPRLYELMRESGVPVRGKRSRTERIVSEQIPDVGLAKWLRSIERQSGREASIVIYRTQRDLELRGPYLSID